MEAFAVYKYLLSRSWTCATGCEVVLSGFWTFDDGPPVTAFRAAVERVNACGGDEYTGGGAPQALGGEHGPMLALQ